MAVKIVNPLTIVKTGGGPTPTPGPLDPQVVYEQTRPANWLKMPTPTDDEYFLLLDVGDNLVDTLPVAIEVINSSDWTLELGTTDAQGVFTADPDLAATGTETKTISVPANKWQDVGLTRQLMARVKINAVSSVANSAQLRLASSSLPNIFLSHYLVELYGKSGGRTNTSSCKNYRRLMFYSVAGELPSDVNFYQMFEGCSSLTAIPQLDTSSSIQFSYMFEGCSSLTAIPQLDTSSGRIFERMFYGCGSLISIPQLDTSSGTNFSGMFSNCVSLISIPQLDTSSGTNFGSMFRGCYSFTTMPQLDTSSGTAFSSMFWGCHSLTAIPQLDTSSGTNFQEMFSSCYSLTTIPQLDTSSGTNFYQMFYYCPSLVSIPQLDTSSGTNFYQMFYYCSSLASIPQLDTSSGTNFQEMFRGCSSLTAIPQLDTSSGTNFNSMFYDCTALTVADLTGYDFSAITTASALYYMLRLNSGGGLTIDFGDTFGTNGIRNTSSIVYSLNTSDAYPCKIRINKTDAMLQIVANASTLFYGSYTYVYVPDDLLATYQADTYWATLGTRLKPMSEWSA